MARRSSVRSVGPTVGRAIGRAGVLAVGSVLRHAVGRSIGRNWMNLSSWYLVVAIALSRCLVSRMSGLVGVQLQIDPPVWHDGTQC